MPHWEPGRSSTMTLHIALKHTVTRTLQRVGATDASSPKLDSFWILQPVQVLWMAASASRALAQKRSRPRVREAQKFSENLSLVPRSYLINGWNSTDGTSLAVRKSISVAYDPAGEGDGRRPTDSEFFGDAFLYPNPPTKLPLKQL